MQYTITNPPVLGTDLALACARTRTRLFCVGCFFFFCALVAFGHASARTITLIDPDGDELVLTTNDWIYFDNIPGQGLTIEVDVIDDLSQVDSSPSGVQSEFEEGETVFQIDGRDYLADLLLFANDGLYLNGIGQTLNCQSVSGLPLFTAVTPYGVLDNVVELLRAAWPGEAIRVEPYPGGGTWVRMGSIYTDVDCGEEYQGPVVYLDGFE